MPRGVRRTAGASVYGSRLHGCHSRVKGCRLPAMPIVDTDDLIDARGVADLLGLSHPNSVSTYQRRYPDMPRPVVDLGEGRCKLWLRAEIQAWMEIRRRNSADCD